MTYLKRKACWVLGMVVLSLILIVKVGMDAISATNARFYTLEKRVEVLEIERGTGNKTGY